jgi:hypothetical protein
VSPQIQDNPDGWGPCSVPTAFKDIPYQPFSKGDRIGKVNYRNSVYFVVFLVLIQSHMDTLISPAL